MYLLSPSIGSNDTTNAFIEHAIPSGVETLYTQHTDWNNGGYFDVFAKSNSGEVMVNRINTHQPNTGNPVNGRWPVVRLDNVASGLSVFTSVVIRVRKGRLHLMGLAWSKVKSDTLALSTVHSDNVIGDPNSLSDTILNVTNKS